MTSLRIRSRASVVMVGVLAGGAFVALPTDALAATPNCTGVFRSRFAGVLQPTYQNIRGAEANIEFNDPDLCGGENGIPALGGSSAWAMLSGYSQEVSGRRAYAQSGYIQWTDNTGGSYDPGIYTFSQYTKKCYVTPSSGACAAGDPGYDTAANATNPSGATAWRYVAAQESSNSDWIYMRVYRYSIGDDLILDHSFYDPDGDWEDWDTQFMGETYYPGDDVPGVDGGTSTGTGDDYTSFTELSWHSGLTNSIAPIPEVYEVSAGQSLAAYHIDLETDETFRIWTDPVIRNNY